MNKVVKMRKEEEIDAFVQNHHSRMKTMLLGYNMHVMTQSLKGVDGPHLPHGLSMVNTYTKVTYGSKHAVVVVKNLMAILVTTVKGVKVTQVVAANAVPQEEVAPRTLEELDKVHGILWTKVSTERGREVLFQQLDLSDLEGWSEGNEVAAHTLLAEYHDIFSLKPKELGCTNQARHEIRVVDDECLK